MTKLNSGLDLKKTLLCAALLSTLVAVIYGQCGNFELITYDDPIYVSNNERVMQGLSAENIAWAFSSFQLANYHPLTIVSHMLDTTMFGDSSGARHLVNVFLHLLNVLLLFFFLLKATSEDEDGGLVPAFFAAAFFAVHPVHVESIAWVTERKDVLSTFFWMAAMHSWLAYANNRNAANYALTFFFTGMGILAKPMVVTLPAALVLLDIWPLGRIDFKKAFPQLGNLLVEKIPLLALSALSSVLTVLAQEGGGAMQSVASFPLSLRISNALVSYATYLGELIAPINLAVFYPYPREIPIWHPVLALLLIIVVSAGCLRLMKSFPMCTVGWFWYLGTLIPVIGLIQVGDQAAADRYAYIPFIGLYMLLAFGTAKLVHKGRVPAKAAIAAGSAIVTVLLVGAYTQAGYWKNSKTLYTRTLAVTENNHHINYNYGNLLEKDKKYSEAATYYRAAIKADPSHYRAMTNLANILSRRGELTAAMDLYKRAIEINPHYEAAYANRGIAYHKQGKLDFALADYRKALALEPNNPNTMVNMSLLQYMRGDSSSAKEWLHRALAIDPENEAALRNMRMIR